MRVLQTGGVSCPGETLKCCATFAIKKEFYLADPRKRKFHTLPINLNHHLWHTHRQEEVLASLIEVAYIFA